MDELFSRKAGFELFDFIRFDDDYYMKRRGIPKDTPTSAKTFPKAQLIFSDRKPMTAAQRAKRNKRNKLAKASRQRNRAAA